MNMIKNLFYKFPFIKKLQAQIARQGAFPAGHFYSPVPQKDEILNHLASEQTNPDPLLDIQINKDHQETLLHEYAAFYNDVCFTEQQNSKQRYYYNNNFFCYADAIFLYCFLRKHRPRKIIKVGSGFSSAAMLDTIER